MARLMLLVKLALGLVAAFLYVWIEAVRRTPAVKRRKAHRRRLTKS